jgi:hypothetical protein
MYFHVIVIICYINLRFPATLKCRSRSQLVRGVKVASVDLWQRVQRDRRGLGGVGTSGMESGVAVRDRALPERRAGAPLPRHPESGGRDETA